VGVSFDAGKEEIGFQVHEKAASRLTYAKQRKTGRNIEATKKESWHLLLREGNKAPSLLSGEGGERTSYRGVRKEKWNWRESFLTSKRKKWEKDQPMFLKKKKGDRNLFESWGEGGKGKARICLEEGKKGAAFRPAVRRKDRRLKRSVRENRKGKRVILNRKKKASTPSTEK